MPDTEMPDPGDPYEMHDSGFGGNTATLGNALGTGMADISNALILESVIFINNYKNASVQNREKLFEKHALQGGLYGDPYNTLNAPHTYSTNHCIPVHYTVRTVYTDL